MIENLRLAFIGIWSHKMRSFLTMLGIIIGIASIIAIVSTIKGTSEQIKENLIGAGNNTVQISLYEGDNEYSSGSYGMDGESSSDQVPILSKAQKEEVLGTEHVLNATFYYSNTNVYNIYYGNKAFSGGTLYGIDQNYLATCGYSVRSGRKFVDEDYDEYRKVCLIDSNAAETLFPSEEPVGKVLEIGRDPFTVIGVVQQNENYTVKINSYEEYGSVFSTMVGIVMIPYPDWPIAVSYDQPQNVVIKADSTDNMSKAGNDAAKALNSFISSKSKYKYKANDIMEKVRSMQQYSESTQQQLIWIAGISLLVGGIGVMNIMLVSVTERTKEIGLKKAIGAPKRVILAQFLTEAAVLTSIGGMIGVAIGVGLSGVVSRVTGAPTAISLPAAGGSVLFSMLIGIIFGLLPSVQAANLNPIDALRSE